MRKCLAALLLAGALTGPALAQEDEIAGTIRSQMEAFLAEDAETAFTFASPGIQGLFGTPENFSRMVREGYPMVWHPGEIRFGGLDERGNYLAQNVYVTDMAGRAHALEYLMEQIDGRWRIAGVRLLDLPEASV